MEQPKFGDVMVAKPNSAEALQVMWYGEDGGLLPEPHRSDAKHFASFVIDNENSQEMAVVQFSNDEDAHKYYEALPDITYDPLTSFPGWWFEYGPTVVVITHG